MTSLVSLLALGFFLGVRHATDADHIIAVSTIVTRERNLKGAALIGAMWGVGHTMTVMLVGGAVILFGVVIPPKVGLAMEFGVGIMLVVLGLFTLSTVSRHIKEQVTHHLTTNHMHAAAHLHPHSAPPGGHLHTHAHGDYIHAHSHGHGHSAHGHAEDDTPPARLDRLLGGFKPYLLIRPLVVGVVHGLAGSAAVALLVLAAVREPLWAIAYLALFGMGTVAGMMLFTSVLALPMMLAGTRAPSLDMFVRAVAGALSVAFGLYLMFEIGIKDGLLVGIAQPSLASNPVAVAN